MDVKPLVGVIQEGRRGRCFGEIDLMMSLPFAFGSSLQPA
jgi:hypothetical protein